MAWRGRQNPARHGRPLEPQSVRKRPGQLDGADLRRPPPTAGLVVVDLTCDDGVFSGVFGVPVERVVELGYPRNDHLLERVDPPSDIVDHELYEHIRHSRPIVGYFPTFRDNTMSIPGGAPVVTQMASIVAERGGTLLFKPHDTSIVDVGDADADFIVLPREADLNAYLGQCDVLVTDFSSVASDFLVLRRPIVLFLPDLAAFLDARGFYFDPVEMAPGLLTTTTEQLYDALRRFDGLPVSPRIDSLIEHYWGDTATAGASRRVAAFIGATTESSASGFEAAKRIRSLRTAPRT